MWRSDNEYANPRCGFLHDWTCFYMLSWELRLDYKFRNLIFEPILHDFILTNIQNDLPDDSKQCITIFFFPLIIFTLYRQRILTHAENSIYDASCMHMLLNKWNFN